MASPLVQYSAAWVLDLYEPSATVYAASTDIYTASAVVTLGQVYPKRIKNGNSITLTEEYSGGTYGVQNTVEVTIVLDDSDGSIDRTKEWREVPFRLRHYDWLADEARTELTGIVVSVEFAQTEAVFRLADRSAAILDMLIPRTLVNVDDFTLAQPTGDALWAASTAYALNVRIRPTVDNQMYYIATTGGTSDTTEPAWPETEADTVVDGSVTWTAYYSDSTGPTDLGAAVPVAFGLTEVNAPLVGVDGDSSPGGQDFIVCPMTDRADAAMSVTVQAAYSDEDSASPGLENVLDWVDALGTITRVNNTSFTVTLTNPTDLSPWYVAHWPVRCFIGGATTYTYTEIASLSGTTVTVKDAVLTGAITGMQIGNTFIAERTRYTIDTVPHLSLRFPEGPSGGVIVRVNNASLTDPVSIVREIIENTHWGCSADAVQSCDATTFGTAITLMGTVGLAVAGNIGGDRRQRRAADVLNELLMLRGMRLKYDGQTNKWKITVDQAAASSLTLGLGVGTVNNVKTIRSHHVTPLDQAVTTLKLRYGNLGRLKLQEGYAAHSLLPGDYKWEVRRTNVHPVGTEETITSPWLQRFEPAVRTAYYLSRRMSAGDRQVEVVCGMEARDVAVGDTVTLTATHDGITALEFTVVKVERTLGETGLSLRGYNSDIFTTALTTIKNDVDTDYGVGTEAESDEILERNDPYGTGGNFAVNGDFSVGLVRTMLEDDLQDPLTSVFGYFVPGWHFTTRGLHYELTDVRVITDGAVIGGAYLEIQGGTSYLSTIGIECLTRLRPSTGEYYSSGALQVQRGQTVIISLFAPRPSDTVPRFSFFLKWATPNEPVVSEYPSTHVTEDSGGTPSAVGAPELVRHWCIARAPFTGIVLPTINLYPPSASPLTYWRFAGVMVERSTAGLVRPSKWKRHSPWGIEPIAIQPGDVQVRPPTTDPGHPATTAGTTVGCTPHTLTLRTSYPIHTVTGAIPAGARVDAVTSRVTTAPGGATTMSIGCDDDRDAWGTGISLAVDTTTDQDDFTVLGPVNMLGAGAKDIIVTTDTAPTTDGEVVLLVHWTKFTPPSA